MWVTIATLWFNEEEEPWAMVTAKGKAAAPTIAMAARVEVEKLGEETYRVRVIEGASESTHQVTVKPNDYRRLTGGKIEAEELVRRSFEFLLAREAKESILAQFDLQVIRRYFPEYEREIRRKT
jgi:hypothetical protein